MSALEKYMAKNGHEATSAPKKRVATVAVFHGKHLLMGKRRDSGKWTTPGGHAEGDEPMHEAAARELAEEAGIKAHHTHLQPLTAPKRVTTDKGETIEVQPFKYEVKDRPNTSMKRDPDAEVHRWHWVDTSNGLPEDIKNNLHVPMERNALLPCLGLGDDDMKNCGELDKYMAKKGMKKDPLKRHDPEEAHVVPETNAFTDEQISADGLHDREEMHSRRAARASKHYDKLNK